MAELHDTSWAQLTRDAVELRDPYDGSYDPKSPPLYIQNDPRLAPGLDHLDRHGRRLGVQLSLGPEHDAYDVPPHIEHMAADVDAFGHSVEESAPREDGYAHRIREVVRSLPSDTESFTHVTDRLDAEEGAGKKIVDMGLFVKGAFEEYQRLIESGASPDDIAQQEARAFVSGAVLTRAVNWSAVAKVGLAAKKAHDEGRPPKRGNWNALVLTEPENARVAHYLGSLGVDVIEGPFRRNEHDWQETSELIPMLERDGRLPF